MHMSVEFWRRSGQITEENAAVRNENDRTKKSMSVSQERNKNGSKGKFL